MAKTQEALSGSGADEKKTTEIPETQRIDTFVLPDTNKGTGPCPNLIRAFLRAQAKASKVEKSGYNSYQEYAYMMESDVINALRPILEEEGIGFIPSLEGIPTIDDYGNTHLIMSYTMVHESGEIWPYPIRFPGSGNDMSKNNKIGDKGVYKALTGANKYGFAKTFFISTSEDEPENEQAPKDHKDTNTETTDLDMTSKIKKLRV